MTIRGFADLSVPPLPSFSERDTLKTPARREDDAKSPGFANYEEIRVSPKDEI
jgi:hypothetical protein